MIRTRRSMDEQQASALMVHMQAKILDTDHLLEMPQAKSLYLRYLEENDYDQIIEICRYFKDIGRFPPVVEFESKRAELFGDTLKKMPTQIASKEAVKMALKDARQLLRGEADTQ